MKKSCDTCPAKLTQASQNRVIGAGIGGNLCGLKLIPIGRPGQQTGRPVAEVVASKCDKYGEQPDYSATATSAAIEIPVAMPLTTAAPRQQDLVTNCRNCENYVPGGVMMTATGWNSGYCVAKGSLLLEDRLTSYATGCDQRSYTPSPMHNGDVAQARNLGIVLLPEFADGYGKLNVAAMLKSLSTDPQEYESDRPVTSGEAKVGIRAWRDVPDPDGYGTVLRLPIFAKDHFDPIAQSKVPKVGDDEHPEDYLDHGGFVYKMTAMWMELDETPVIWGPPGNGKTELYRHMAFLMGLPFERISITASSEVDDLLGKMAYSPERGTYFQYGRIPKAWGTACVVCLDEPNAGPPEVWQAIRPLTDNSKQLVVDQNEGERHPRHPCCYMGMAMNPPWDHRNTGIATLADADGSRLMHIFMDLPPAAVERAILAKVLSHDGWDGPDAKRAIDQVMVCADELRRLSHDGIIPITWGIRTQIKVVRSMRFFNPVQAFRIGAADALERGAQEAILDVVKSRIE